jgi:glyoxylase-like metal-dependent hydrolase (beta-lactamase superfamily II)
MSDRYTWASEIEQVADAVYRLPLPLPNDGLRAVNVYALVGDGICMIDSGWALAQSEDVLTASLAAVGLDLAEVRDFLVTHVHRDHYSQAVAVRRKFGTRVSLGAGERVGLEALQHAIATDGPIDRFPPELRRGGAPEVARAWVEWLAAHESVSLDDWESPDRWLDDGDRIEVPGRSLRAVSTPGHTRGHLVFHDAAHGLLFAGDHVLPHITPSIAVELVPDRYPLRSFLGSLRRVLELPDARLLPAHGPVADSVHARARELIAHHDVRLSEMARAVRQGASTAAEVAAQVRWTRHGLRVEEMDLFNTNLAICETLAHLDLLALDGAITVDHGADGVDRFASSSGLTVLTDGVAGGSGLLRLRRRRPGALRQLGQA